MYLMSFPTHNEHWRETGFLAGEAAIDSLIPVEIMKYSLGGSARIRETAAERSSREALRFHRNTPLSHGRSRASSRMSIQGHSPN